MSAPGYTSLGFPSRAVALHDKLLYRRRGQPIREVIHGITGGRKLSQEDGNTTTAQPPEKGPR